MKRKTLVTATAVIAAFGLALSGCAANDGGPNDNGDNSNGDSANKYTIGITQIVQHPALDAAREGFMQAFTDAGLKEGTDVEYVFKNANDDIKTAASIASEFASNGDLDLILAIATPSAQAMAEAVQKVPVLFTAVTDPVAAGIVESLDAPGANVTGTHDLNPVADQIKLIKDTLPDAKSIGVIYSSGEINSTVQVDIAENAAKDLGIEIVRSTVTNSNEIPPALEKLRDVDAIYIPTDNTLTKGIDTVIDWSESNKIPFFGAEGNQVVSGAAATYGINYRDLGYQTGEMAVKILKDNLDPGKIPVEGANKVEPYVNLTAAKNMGITLPAALVSQAKELGGDHYTE